MFGYFGDGATLGVSPQSHGTLEEVEEQWDTYPLPRVRWHTLEVWWDMTRKRCLIR